MDGERLRVLMLSWEYPPRCVGGLAEHVYHLSRHLADRGVKVEVFTAGLPGSPATAREGGVAVHRVAGFGPASPDFLSWVLQLNLGLVEAATRVLTGAVRNGRATLLHVHDWLVAFAGRALKHAFRLPVVATVHATEAGRHGGVHTPEQRFINDVEWWLTYEAWRVVCCSRYMAGELENAFRLPPDKVRVLPNGVDPASLAPPPGCRGGRGRERFAAPDERLVFFIGRLVPEKGVQVLLEALPQVLARQPRTKVVIAGTGPFEQHLRSRAEALGVDAHVYFTGYVDDLTRRQLYQWADLAVYPSLYEPFGIVALEAMAAGVPVMVARTGGLAEIVEDGVDGLCVPPGRADALAQALLRFLADPGMAARLTQAARRKVRQRFLWPQVAAATVELYREVIREGAGNPWMRAGGAAP
ncbi:MAG: glycosyltransferase family 4 protein [Acetobacteraceae bacterium]|nr:glycosyltransferase family 4 protein [Acetobacteraceae bacterium]